MIGVSVAQNHYRNADNDEGQQRADVHHLSDVVDRRDAAHDRGEQADEHSVLVGGAKLGVHRSEELFGQQAVVGHRVEYAGLAEKHDQHDAREASKRPQGDDVRRRGKAAIQKSACDGRFDVNVLPMNHARQHTGHGNVKNRADEQGNDDADGKIALGILGFLSGCGDGVKSDICEKDVRGASPDAGKTHRRERMPVVAPVGKVDVVDSQTDDEEHDRHFDGHDGGIEASALFDADDQDRRDDQGDYERGQIKPDLHSKHCRSV